MTATPFDSLTVNFSVAWASDPFAASPSWTDETANVRSWATDRGRSGDLDEFPTGRLVVVLDNSTRRYDPLYASSPLSPNVLPGKKCQLTLTYSAVSYIVFTGFLDSLDQSSDPANTLGLATLTALDGTAMLARARLANNPGVFVGANETIGQRAGRMLDRVGWPAADREIDTDLPAVEALEETGQTFASQMALEGAGDLCQQFIKGDGKFCLRGRRWQAGHNLTASATIGDATSGEISYSDVGISLKRSEIINRASGALTGGQKVDLTDSASKTAYGESGKDLGTVTLVNPNVLQNSLEWILAYNKDPRSRVPQVTFNPRKNPAAIYPVVLAAEIGTRWTFNRRPQNVGAAISRDVIVQGVSLAMNANPGTFTARFNLSDAPGPSGSGGFWRIGVDKLGSSGTAVWA